MTAPRDTTTGDRNPFSRRDFLRVGGVGVVGMALPDQTHFLNGGPLSERQAILVVLAGGASQFEMFDPKPDAPTRIRGISRAIATSVPGLQFSENLPRLAERADQLAVVRTLHHEAAAIHRTGWQILERGCLPRNGCETPRWSGRVATSRTPREGRVPFSVLLPGLGLTPVGIPSEETSADRSLRTVTLATEVSLGEGLHPFAAQMRLACQQLEAGSRCVTVYLGAGGTSLAWDAHGDPRVGPTTVHDYRDDLCPAFDAAMAGFLDGLQERGRLNSTLVVVATEMGRSPHLNDRGGRDHWTENWSGFLAGAGISGGSVIGRTAANGCGILDTPVPLQNLSNTLLQWMGVDLETGDVANGHQTEPPLIAAPLLAAWR